MKIIINNEVIGKNIKSLREKNNISIDELSFLAGISKNRLINYEDGYKNINVKDIISLCNFFNIPIDSIVAYMILH